MHALKERVPSQQCHSISLTCKTRPRACDGLLFGVNTYTHIAVYALYLSHTQTFTRLPRLPPILDECDYRAEFSHSAATASAALSADAFKHTRARVPIKSPGCGLLECCMRVRRLLAHAVYTHMRTDRGVGSGMMECYEWILYVLRPAGQLNHTSQRTRHAIRVIQIYVVYVPESYRNEWHYWITD